MSEDNSELDLLLDDLRRPRKVARLAVLRFALMVEYYATEEEARRRLEKLEPFERVALVDRETGFTRCLRKYYEFVMARLRRDGTAPAEFLRSGALRLPAGKTRQRSS